MVRFPVRIVHVLLAIACFVLAQPLCAQAQNDSKWQANKLYESSTPAKSSTKMVSRVNHFSADEVVKPDSKQRARSASHLNKTGKHRTVKIVKRPSALFVKNNTLNTFQSDLEVVPKNMQIDSSVITKKNPIVLVTQNSALNDFEPPPVPANTFKATEYSAIASTKSSSDFDDVIWWPQQVSQPLEAANSSETATSDELLHLSLASSPRIQAISIDPLIREMQVIEADAEFDPVLYTRNLFEDRTDPVGSTLTTAGADFLKDHIFTSDSGIRRKLRTGADVELSERLGFQNSNAQFFFPQDQGTATLAINVSQPLLRNGGRYYNRIQILIAQSAGNVAWDVFSSELQDEIQRVLSAYWQLYFDRSNFLQVQRNVKRGQVILDTLNQRRELDSLPSQIARARSAVYSRKTDLANAFRDIKDAETTIRKLIGESNWLEKQLVEILPVEQPSVIDFDVPMQQVVYSALENRPEIRESVNRTRIAGLQLDISSNELLPDLTLLMGAYASGLEGDSGIERAFVEQFSNTTPGYSLGLEFEIPYRNRAARSRLSQSHLQLRKLRQELQESIQRVIAESQIAYRRVQSAIQTLRAARTSVEAAKQDLQQQKMRFQSFALIEGDLADGQTPTTLLDQLLDSQERLTSAENVYALTMLELQVSAIALNRATGTLLQHKQISFEKQDGDIAPNIHLYKSGPPSNDVPAELPQSF